MERPAERRLERPGAPRRVHPWRDHLVRVPRERPLPGQHLVQQQAERVDVALRRPALALAGFGRRPLEHLEPAGAELEPRLGRRRVALLDHRIEPVRKVSHPDVDQRRRRLAPEVDQDVRRVEVAVQDPPVMQRDQRPRELPPDRDQVGRPERLTGDAEFARPLALRQRHGDERLLPARRRPAVDQLGQGRMTDRAEHPCLAGEPHALLEAGLRPRAEQLERHVARRVAVIRAVDLGLRPDAEHLDQLVAPVEQERFGVVGVGDADRLEPPLELLGGRHPLLRQDRYRRGHQRLELRRHLARRSHLDHRPVLPRRREDTCAELIDRHPERIGIKARVRLDQCHLGRVEAGRPNHFPDLGLVPRHRREPAGLYARPVVDLGDPQVDQLHDRPPRRTVDLHDVAGLHVTVNHPDAVQRFERAGHLRRQLDDLAPRQRPAPDQPLVEALPGQVLERHVRRPIRGLPDREHLNHVRVP